MNDLIDGAVYCVVHALSFLWNVIVYTAASCSMTCNSQYKQRIPRGFIHTEAAKLTNYAPINVSTDHPPHGEGWGFEGN